MTFRWPFEGVQFVEVIFSKVSHFLHFKVSEVYSINRSRQAGFYSQTSFRRSIVIEELSRVIGGRFLSMENSLKYILSSEVPLRDIKHRISLRSGATQRRLRRGVIHWSLFKGLEDSSSSLCKSSVGVFFPSETLIGSSFLWSPFRDYLSLSNILENPLLMAFYYL